MTSDDPDKRTRERAGTAGATLFGAAALMELVRMFTRSVPWPGFNARINWLMSLFAIVLWAVSAYALARHRRDLLIVTVFGAFWLFSYGILGTAGRSSFGIVYVVFGIAMPIVARLAFGGPLPIGTPAEVPPLPEERGREVL